MPPTSAGPRRGCALAVLIAATGAAFALAAVRHHLGVVGGMAPAEASVIAAAQWTLWVLTDYVVAVLVVASALTVVGRVGSAHALLRAVPVMMRPLLGALLGVAFTATPAAAASPPPLPAAAGPSVTADPFDWSAPADAVRGIEAAARRTSASMEIASARRAPPGQSAFRTVRVRDGDCLWSLAARDLAARHLGSRPADVAGAWRRWYAVNRVTIGPDPGLLRPGEILRAPPAVSPPNPSSQVARRHR